LEEELIAAYLHAENFKGILFQDLKSLFDACDKDMLQQQAERHGHQAPMRNESQRLNPFTVLGGALEMNFVTACFGQQICIKR